MRLFGVFGYRSLRRLGQSRVPTRNKRNLVSEAIDFRKRRWAYPAFVVSGCALLLLPVPMGLPSFVRGPSDVEEFLRSAWQVEATAVALAAAFVVFALQVLANTPRRGLTLAEFARDS